MQNFNLSMIDDPAVFKINVLPARSDTVICDKSGRPARLSLHGMWKFHYAENPSSAVAGFEQPDMDVSGWKEIPVPSNIQMEGYDAPAYVNSQYPWDGREDLATGQAPRIFNPTAQYVTFFEVPESWKNTHGCRCFTWTICGGNRTRPTFQEANLTRCLLLLNDPPKMVHRSTIPSTC